jgi:hypothetical protein
MGAPVTRQKPMKELRSWRMAGFDTETEGLDGKLLLTQFFHEDHDKPVTFKGVAGLINCIFDLSSKLLKSTVIYAHNAEYDWRYIIQAIIDRGYDIIPRERAAGKFYELRIVDRERKTPKGEPLLITRFRDSMAVYPGSLASFTKSFAPEFAKLDIGLSRGVIFNPEDFTHILYAENDVLGLVRAAQKFDELIYENFHVHLGPTTSSTAYAAWLRFAPEGEYHDRQSPRIEAFLRRCYHGGVVGLNAIFGLEYGAVKSLDINSSYPANMRCGVPKGKAVRTYRYRRGFPGFYRTTATVPDNAILPIVPFRSPDGQLAWQTGTFESCLSSAEIDYCETLGCTFIVHEGVYFPAGLTHCFDDFVDVCERLRAEFKGTPTEIVVKLMQNSLYGRFGMRTDGRECLISPDGQPDDMESIFDPKTGETIPHAFYKKVERDTPYMLPHYAAWITANARILIDKACELAGREHVLYRDTDSIHTIGAIDQMAPMIGLEYGKLKVEKDKFRVIYRGPKMYTYFDEKDIPQAVYKAIPRSRLRTPDSDDPAFADKMQERAWLIKHLHDGDEIEINYHSSTSLATFLRTGIKYVIRKRRPTDPFNIYGHYIDDEKRFRPRKAGMNDTNNSKVAKR